MSRWTVLIAAVVCFGVVNAGAETVRVKDAAGLRRAVAGAQPGTRVVLAEGHYGQVSFENVRGAPGDPIVIEGEAGKEAVFGGGVFGFHLRGCEHVVLRNLVVRRVSGNGINIDDAGRVDRPSHHVVLEDVRVFDVGPKGNRDGIKLSGLDDFVLRNVRVEGWGGSAVDMVGCHRGLIEDCRFVGKEGFSLDNGVQTKGASSEVTVRRCGFVNAGQRAVNIGGSTGRAFFRPAGAKYEAKGIVVEGCTFVGSAAPINFVGVDGAVVRYNTIVDPKRWVVRILQETTEEGFVPSRNGVFEKNVVVYEAGKVGSVVNVGVKTQPESFVFRGNVWYAKDEPGRSRPRLPAEERGGVYGVDPGVRVTEAGEVNTTAGMSLDAGAGALKSE